MATRTRLVIGVTSSALLVSALAFAPPAGGTLPADPPKPRPEPSQARIDYAGAVATLRKEIPQVMADGKAVGLTIALVDGRRTVWTRGFGLANRERDIPVTRKTLFHIGSTSKTMTAMAIMQLVEQGLVDLDAPLTRYIPGFRMRSSTPLGNRGPSTPLGDRNPVTVRSIMTHHSGIPGDVMNLADLGKKPEADFYARALRQLRKELPTRRVGKAWAYSNLAIQMLQGVVENVSGKSFLQYTRRKIFKRLGMTSTSFDDSLQGWRRLAASYEVVPDGSKTIRRAREYVNIRPAGSVYSNAVDMARYLKAMIGRGRAPGGSRVLRRATVKQMIIPQKASPWDRMFFKQGLVWWIGHGSPWLRQVVNHGGDTFFHHSMAAWLPKDKLGVFVSVNTANPANVTRTVWQRALALMLQAKTGELPPAPRGPGRVVAPDRAEMRAMAATYANSSGVVEIEVAGDALRVTSGAQNPGAPAHEVTRRSDGWYTSDEGMSLRMTTIEGQRVLLARAPDGTQGLFAQRIPKSWSMPKAWRNRVGTYRMTGISKNRYPRSLDDPGLMPLSTYRGVLLLGASVLKPVSKSLAFTFGPMPMQVMRDAGFSVEARDGFLRFGGARLVRLPASAAAQALPDPAATPWTAPLAPPAPLVPQP